MKSFAIVLVCYNRLEGLKRLLSSLERVDYAGRNDIELIFSIDNSGTSIIAEFAEKYNWPFGHKTIRTFSQRQGLKNHILQCGDYTQKYDIIVVLEDDIYVSDSMYHFASQTAEYYWDDDRIAGISLYTFQKNWLKWLLRFEPQKSIYDVFFLKVAMSWGQVWTTNKWAKFKKWYEQHSSFEKTDSNPHAINQWPESSWLKFHDKYCIDTNRYFVYPYVSISTNFSDAGEHNTFSVSDHQVELQLGKKEYSLVKFSADSVTYDEFMEREYLGSYLNVDDSELTVDIWGNKPPKYFKKYVLTINTLPYKVISSYALALRPAELNIILGYKGTDIKLYDTSFQDTNKTVDADYIRYIYSMRTHDSKTVFMIGLKMLQYLLLRLRMKLKRRFKR